MEILNPYKYFLFISFVLFTYGCQRNIDLRGTISSTDNANERFAQSLEWNNENPPKTIQVNTDDYSILVSGDSHLGGTENLKRVLDSAAMPEISAYFLSGDNTTGHVADYEVLKQLLDDADSVKSFPIAGNHDLFFDGWKSFFSLFGSSTFEVIIQTPTSSDLFICLDTGGATLGDKQLDWLRNILKTRRELFRNCIFITHNNFIRNHYTGSTNLRNEEMIVLLDLFAEFHVNALIAGHDHTRNEDHFGVTDYITLDALQDGDDRASYLKVSFRNGTPEHEFIKL